MNKKVVSILSASMMISVIAGCSGNNNEPAASSSPASASTASSSPGASGASSGDAAKQKVTITALKYKYGEVPPTDKNGVNLINEHFNVDYQINMIPQGSYSDKLSAVFASGTLPDIISFEGDDAWNRYPKFAKQGAFADLDSIIQQYPSMSGVPDYIYDQFKVDGKIYAIPTFSPARSVFSIMIRKDWLDNLNLSVPTSYEELKKVALAFTNDDPDKNGKKDTYGFALGKDLNPKLNMGTYWDPTAWYHKDEQGRFIPGSIAPGYKEVVQTLADLYKQGAVTPDFVTLDWANTNKEFYSGKAGIFIAAINGMSEDYVKGLLAIQPEAKFVSLEAFKAPDGSQGWTAARGFGGFNVISAQAAKDPVKLERILEILEFSRKFYPVEDRKETNPDYDFYLGNVGVSYDMVDGKPKFKENAVNLGLAPSTFLPDGGWPAKEADMNYPAGYSLPLIQELTGSLANHLNSTNWYASPNYPVISQTNLDKGAQLDQYLIDEQTKMIAGQRPVSDWDKMVDEWKKMGGEQIIQEVNAGIAIKDASEAWIK
ncbi:extracellular solute-binding protein [Cohnella hashimotonis]|uniref:Extracellular solute-binding protein n=1 Tax=Cohnella hashimotonis TaxID=2826895 RepID=A0ABT6TDZ0_9BACL|nr:extracellular solute-binding protein [Cohnella hashimotonis]MDI4645026.1 extracellular solute-binding protein [Cohnella hashimotonis]